MNGNGDSETHNEQTARDNTMNTCSAMLVLNVQSLLAHLQHLTTDRVHMMSSVLCLTGTRVTNRESVEIYAYRLLSQNKRPFRNGGVAQYVKLGTFAYGESSAVSSLRRLYIIFVGPILTFVDEELFSLQYISILMCLSHIFSIFF